MSKRTDELDFELKNADNVHSYIAVNETEFDDKSFYRLLNSLIVESGKTKAKIAAGSCISEPYMYNLINAEKRPTRDTVIKLSFGLQLPLETAERMLKLAGYSGFYVRHKRDVILKYAIKNSFNLMETDELLAEYGFSIMAE